MRDEHFEDELRNEFASILYKLANINLFEKDEDEKILKDICDRFNNLYGLDIKSNDNLTSVNDKNFRHYYVDIWMVITNIKEDNSKGDISNLLQNVDLLIFNGEKVGLKCIDKIRKLYDHLNLEIMRLFYFERVIRNEIKLSEFAQEVANYSKKYDEESKKINEEIDKIDEQSKKISERIEKLSEKNEKIETKVTNYQKESIAILGIFTSIVITFVSGGILSSSILENILKIDMYITIAIFLIFSIVMFNILVSLYYFIIKIVNIRRGDRETFLNEYKYLIVPNIIFIILFFIDLILVSKFSILVYSV